MEILNLEFILGMSFALFILGIVYLCFSTFRVEEGHLAVLTSFGAAVKNSNQEQEEELKVFSPGIHFKKPWHRVHIFSSMERILDLSEEKGGHQALTSDGTVLRLQSQVRLKPLSTHYYAYLFEMKQPLEHLKEMFLCLLRNEIANFSSQIQDKPEFISSYSEIRRDRQKLNQLVKSYCQNFVNNRYGVEFKGIDLIDILPPHELDNALNAIQNAQTESDTLYARAEADSNQRVAAAEKGLEISKLRAEAMSIEIKTLGEMVEKLIEEGQWKFYLRHRKTEILGDSKLTFVQKEL